MLNIIDISSWQRGLDLRALFQQNPALDGVIVKATGGRSFVQSTCDPWVQVAIQEGRPWGFYHYLDDDGLNSTGEAEADWFVDNCLNYFGYGIPVADYEGRAKDLGPRYLLSFLERVKERTGAMPLVYCSLAVLREQDLSQIAAKGYKLWLAQYASMSPTGIQDKPWQSGSVAPFSGYVMHQYSSAGRLTGYNGDLDLDKFQGTREDWDALAGVKASPVQPEPAPPADPAAEIDRDTMIKVIEVMQKALREVEQNLNKIKEALL